MDEKDILSPDPFVSVIMAINKYTPYLEDAINSILEQEYKDFEFIIVANCCEMSLINYLNTFKDPRIRIFVSDICQLSYNLNLAIGKATGELVARMDADDVSLPGRLSQQVLYMRNNRNIDVLGSSYEIIDAEGAILGQCEKPVTNSKIRAQLFFKNPLCHPSVMYKRSTILKVGGYLGGRVSEDYGLWLRLARDPLVIFENTREALLEYRIHENQSKGDLLAYEEVSGLILTELLRRPTLLSFMGFGFSITKYLLIRFKKWLNW